MSKKQMKAENELYSPQAKQLSERASRMLQMEEISNAANGNRNR
jgi:hypothetical protein